MHFKPPSVVAMLAIAGHGLGQDADNGTIGVPATAPTDAHGPIDRSFVSFHCQTDLFNVTVGVGGKPNMFTANLLRSLSNVTGGQTMMRVGGSKGDAGASYTPTEPGHGLAFPPSFFKSFSSIPDIDYIFQLPVLPGNVTNAVEFFKAGFKNIPSDALYAVELGNELNVHFENANGSFAYKTYVDKFLQFENAVIATGLLQDTRVFQAIDSQNAEGWKQDIPQHIFPLGINNNSNIKTVAMHYYQAISTKTLQSQLMNHSQVTRKMSTYLPSIQYMRKKYPSIPFFLDEVGNAELGKPVPAFQCNFGAALWAVDMMLYSMIADVDRVGFIIKDHLGASPFIAYGDDAQVLPDYYSQQFTASFIGNSKSATSVALLSNTTLYPVYGAYDSGALKRLALINFLQWDPPTSTSTAVAAGSTAVAAGSTAAPARPTHTFTLKMPSGVKSVHVERLSSPDGAMAGAGGMTWMGTQWTKQSAGLPVKGVRNDGFNVAVSGGVVNIPVPATEAVMVFVQ